MELLQFIYVLCTHPSYDLAVEASMYLGGLNSGGCGSGLEAWTVKGVVQTRWWLASKKGKRDTLSPSRTFQVCFIIVFAMSF